MLARLSDMVGRKPTVLLSFFFFFVFSLGSGFSNSLSRLTACRTFQGIGGAGLYTMAMILLIEISSPKLVPFVGSIIGATIAVAGSLGPILGGLLAYHASWRWIFWLKYIQLAFESMPSRADQECVVALYVWLPDPCSGSPSLTISRAIIQSGRSRSLITLVAHH